MKLVQRSKQCFAENLFVIDLFTSRLQQLFAWKTPTKASTRRFLVQLPLHDWFYAAITSSNHSANQFREYIYSSLATRHSQIDAIWSAGFCDWGNWGTVLAKAAIDCFVSLFCSSRPLTPHWSSMAVPPWEWFYWRSLPVQKAFFLPSVTKCLLTGDHLTFRVLFTLPVVNWQ